MKIVKYPAIALASLALFAACDDDNDDNPSIAPATEFVFNTPSFLNTTVDLANSDSLAFSWSQPNWGFPIQVSYVVELSKSGEFTHSYTEAISDETGATVADYYELDATNSCSHKIAGKDICRAIASLSSWADNSDVPGSQDIYLRVKATPTASQPTADLITNSNVIKVTTHPYYIALKDADPEIWYLVGACIGDGKWNHKPEGLGVSNFPMSITADGEYDKNTGKGVIVFNGYLTPDGFKIIRVRGDWNDQWGMNDGAFVFQDGGSGNIVVAESGFYTVSLNTASTGADAVTIVPYEGATPKLFESICMSGSFNDWGDTPMTAFSVVDGVENHLWSGEIESDGSVELKFKNAGNWDNNWGGTTFPYGVGVQGGSNIVVPAGAWIVTFNDVDGSYAFTAK